jgi:hypothetical protein
MVNKSLMFQLKLQGASYNQIAEAVGLSRQRIQQLLSPSPKIKRFILQKYEGKCAKCGFNVGKSGHIHHIFSTVSNKEIYNSADNLILLCNSCHRSSHRFLGEAPPYDNTRPCICQRCGHQWNPRIDSRPQCCPACKSYNWNKPRKREIAICIQHKT